MKTLIKSSIIILIGIIGLLKLSACEDKNAACKYEIECQNGGELVLTDFLGNCVCSCPDGFSGELCEIYDITCSNECPEGQSPNPSNDCLCE